MRGDTRSEAPSVFSIIPSASNLCNSSLTLSLIANGNGCKFHCMDFALGISITLCWYPLILPNWSHKNVGNLEVISV